MNVSRSIVSTVVGIGLVATLAIGVQAREAGASPERRRTLAPGVERLLDDGAGHRARFGADYSAHEVDGIAHVGDGIMVARHAEHSRHRALPDAWTLETWIVGQPGTFETDMPTADGAFLPDPDGSVWFVSEGQFVAHFDGSGWEIVSPQQSQDNYVSAALDGDGRVWGVWDSGLASFQDGQWTRYGTELGVPASCPSAVAVGPDGQVIVGLATHEDDRSAGSRGGGLPDDSQPDGSDAPARCGTSPILRFDGAGWQPVPVPDSLAESGIAGLAFGPAGDLWVAAGDRSGSGRVDGDFVLAHAAGNDGTLRSVDGAAWMDALDPRSMIVGRDGALWAVNTDGGGILRTNGTSVERWLDGREVRFLTVGPDGDIWAVGPSGLYIVAPAQTTDG